MELFLIATFAVIITIFIMSKLNSGIKHEEECVEKIQNAHLKKGPPIGLGEIRDTFRTAVDVVNKINNHESKPIYLSLRHARIIALNGLVDSIESSSPPLDALIKHYHAYKATNNSTENKDAVGRNQTSEMLHFNSVVDAFSYICQYMNTKPILNHSLPAIVNEIIPGQKVRLLIPDNSVGHVNNIPVSVSPELGNLSVGSFVLIGIDSVDENGTVDGVVFQEITPSFDLSSETWLQKTSV